MLYIKTTTIEEYNALNDLASVIRNYHLASVQAETGTTSYASADPVQKWTDEEGLIFDEQNEEGTLSICYMFPVDNYIAPFMMQVIGRKIYDNDFNFLLSA